ncbi:hypothetical protein BDM02DRAFT_1879369 [Thelephora ganbajun]|uniref:Uncharacterized protein n=1 Tax=Thelephora ganbajun TaxID=370292 RepID=A0ACB6ZTW6_THEGA|nr:hypothetical protein BDM02DRAFT_1879369 [Thelephora ganbajun]
MISEQILGAEGVSREITGEGKHPSGVLGQPFPFGAHSWQILSISTFPTIARGPRHSFICGSRVCGHPNLNRRRLLQEILTRCPSAALVVPQARLNDSNRKRLPQPARQP